MKILSSELMAKAAAGLRVFLGLHKVEYEHKGTKRSYFMVTRGEKIIPPEEKKPDAVVIVGIIKGDPDQLVITKEFRIPLGCEEYGFPAGLIDAKDYGDNRSVQEAAYHAAIREFKEETGLEFIPDSCSPPNLYSSAGMTNESAIIVFGHATGTPSQEFLEPSEEISVLLLNHADLGNMVSRDDLAFGKVSWPIMHLMAKHGFE